MNPNDSENPFNNIKKTTELVTKELRDIPGGYLPMSFTYKKRDGTYDILPQMVTPVKTAVEYTVNGIVDTEWEVLRMYENLNGQPAQFINRRDAT